MDRTLRKKLTHNPATNFLRIAQAVLEDGTYSLLRDERELYAALKQEMLQPRPEAVSKLLELARAI